MTKQEWQNKINEACKSAGTYQAHFDSVIDILAETMELRDNAFEKYIESGGDTVVIRENTRGKANLTKNPALTVIDDLTKTALTYWRDLGLTPKGLKAINDGALKHGGDGKATLNDVLKSINI